MSLVLVSGLGVVANAGATVETFWDNLLRGKSLFSPLHVMPGLDLPVGAVVGDAWNEAILPPKSQAVCDRASLLAIAAAAQALREAGLDGPFAAPERVAVVMGNGAGDQTAVEDGYRRNLIDGKKPHPFTVARTMSSASASWISIAFGARGPCFVTASACASSVHAIGTAAALIRAGLVDVAIAGGVEAGLTRGSLLSWDAMRVLSRGALRPYAKGRDGLIVAEGAGVLVLESEAHARARGRRGETALLGYGCCADAGDMLSPDSEGMVRGMHAALTDAGLAPAEIDYINGHGVGTRANDLAEMKALAQLFGREPPPCSSIKAVTGHAMGASGALEAVASVLSLRKQMAPPTGAFDEPEPGCALDLIAEGPRAMSIRTVLSNSFAFGGLNASLLFGAV